jgi:hypothetical protein
LDSSGQVDRQTGGITPEIAEIDREREITVACLHAATEVVTSLDPEKLEGDDLTLFKDARGFLQAWWARKKPVLEMPKGF